MPTGTRSCGCPSRRCACGHVAAKKAGISEQQGEIRLKRKRSSSSRRSDSHLQDHASRKSSLDEMEKEKEKLPGNVGKQNCSVEVAENGKADADRIGLNGFSEKECKCDRTAGAASSAADGAVDIKGEENFNHEAQTGEKDKDSRRDKDENFKQSRHIRSSSLRPCGCPARKCRCGARGGVSTAQFNSSSSLNNANAKINSFAGGAGDHGRAKGGHPILSSEVREGKGGMRGEADAASYAPSIDASVKCECGKPSCTPGREGGKFVTPEGKGDNSMKEVKSVRSKRRTGKSKFDEASVNGGDSAEEMGENGARNGKDMLTFTVRRGPGSGKRACGCPARICRCGAQSAPANLASAANLRPRHRQAPGSYSEVSKLSVNCSKGKGPGTGRRMCGCPSRLCTCGAAALLCLSLSGTPSSSTAISGEGEIAERGEKEDKVSPVVMRDLETTSFRQQNLRKNKKKGPGTGRRACGCPARKCHCGASAPRAHAGDLVAQKGGKASLATESDDKENLPFLENCRIAVAVDKEIPGSVIGYKGDGVERKRRSKKRKKRFTAVSDVARIKARVKNQLHRIRLERNLLDIYCQDGWKGSSREKVRPDSELERARRQIIRSKLAIRSSLEELYNISLQGAIDMKAFDQDGRINHEQIFCAKCNTSKITKDNDIILCDGTCNRAFHQKCLEPPLKTSDIPPGEEGWLCPACDCILDCINAINADTDAGLSLDTFVWESVFAGAVKEAEEGGLPVSGFDDEWPSDDAEDEDYDPTKRNSPERTAGVENGVESAEDSSREEDEDEDEEDTDSESDEEDMSGSLKDEMEAKEGSVEGGDDFLDDDGEDMDIEERERRRTERSRHRRVLRSQGGDALKDAEGLPEDWVEKVEEEEEDDPQTLIIVGKRRRNAVDYKKLNEELFGTVGERDECTAQDDAEWGPRKKRKKIGVDVTAVPVAEENCEGKGGEGAVSEVDARPENNAGDKTDDCADEKQEECVGDRKEFLQVRDTTGDRRDGAAGIDDEKDAENGVLESVEDFPLSSDGEMLKGIGGQSRGSRYRPRLDKKSVEALEQVFTVNQLPSKAHKEHLARKLFLPFEHVDRWFRNVRHKSLKSGISSPTRVRNKRTSLEWELEGENSPSEELQTKGIPSPADSPPHLPTEQTDVVDLSVNGAAVLLALNLPSLPLNSGSMRGDGAEGGEGNGKMEAEIDQETKSLKEMGQDGKEEGKKLQYVNTGNKKNVREGESELPFLGSREARMPSLGADVIRAVSEEDLMQGLGPATAALLAEKMGDLKWTRMGVKNSCKDESAHCSTLVSYAKGVYDRDRVRSTTTLKDADSNCTQPSQHAQVGGGTEQDSERQMRSSDAKTRLQTAEDRWTGAKLVSSILRAQRVEGNGGTDWGFAEETTDSGEANGKKDTKELSLDCENGRKGEKERCGIVLTEMEVVMAPSIAAEQTEGVCLDVSLKDKVDIEALKEHLNRDKGRKGEEAEMIMEEKEWSNEGVSVRDEKEEGRHMVGAIVQNSQTRIFSQKWRSSSLAIGEQVVSGDKGQNLRHRESPGTPRRRVKLESYADPAGVVMENGSLLNRPNTMKTEGNAAARETRSINGFKEPPCEHNVWQNSSDVKNAALDGEKGGLVDLQTVKASGESLAVEDVDESKRVTRCGSQSSMKTVVGLNGGENGVGCLHENFMSRTVKGVRQHRKRKDRSAGDTERDANANVLFELDEKLEDRLEKMKAGREKEQTKSAEFFSIVTRERSKRHEPSASPIVRGLRSVRVNRMKVTSRSFPPLARPNTGKRVARPPKRFEEA